MSRVSVGFMNSKSKKLWMKSFRDKNSAMRAVLGITKKSKNLVQLSSGAFAKEVTTRSNIFMAPSKGVKYGKYLKRSNR